MVGMVRALMAVDMVEGRMEFMVEERMGFMVEERMGSKVLFRMVGQVEEVVGMVGKTVSLKFFGGPDKSVQNSRQLWISLVDIGEEVQPGGGGRSPVSVALRPSSVVAEQEPGQLDQHPGVFDLFSDHYRQGQGVKDESLDPIQEHPHEHQPVDSECLGGSW